MDLILMIEGGDDVMITIILIMIDDDTQLG